MTMERTLIAALVADIRDAHDASLDGFHEAARETLLGAMQAGNAFLAAPAPAVLRRDDGTLSGVFVAAHVAPALVPPGFVLVPVEPTIRQLAAMGPAIRACYGMDGPIGNVGDVYRAMLEAAPKVTP